MFQVACCLVFFWLKTVALFLVCSFPFVVSAAAAPAAWPDNGPVVEKKGGGKEEERFFVLGEFSLIDWPIFARLALHCPSLSKHITLPIVISSATLCDWIRWIPHTHTHTVHTGH